MLQREKGPSREAWSRGVWRETERGFGWVERCCDGNVPSAGRDHPSSYAAPLGGPAHPEAPEENIRPQKRAELYSHSEKTHHSHKFNNSAAAM